MSRSRRAFRDELAKTYPSEADQRRVVKDLALAEARIAFDARAINTWSSILDEVEATNRRQDLVDLAVGEYGTLAAAANAYLTPAAPAPVARPSPAELVRLLPMLYELYELRMLVGENVPELVHSVAWENAATEVALDLVTQLEKRGRLDAAWFAALLKSRPGRANEIRAVAGGLGIVVP